MHVFQDRLTVVTQVCHESLIEGGATATNYQYDRPLDTIEQPWKRRCFATEDWKLLDLGWIKEAALLVITNEVGKSYQTLPSEDEKAFDALQVIEVGIAQDEDPSLTDVIPLTPIRPGEGFHITPIDIKRFAIRSQRGQARFDLFVVPT